MEQKGEEEHEKKGLKSDVKEEEKAMPDQPTSSTSPQHLPPPDSSETKPEQSETLVQQVKHAVGHVVEAINERLEFALHVSSTDKKETIQSDQPLSAQEKATLPSQQPDNSKLDIKVSEPVAEVGKKTEEMAIPARPASKAKDLLEPNSQDSTGLSVASNERSAAEEEILSTIEHVEDWAAESGSEEEEEEEEEEEDYDEEEEEEEEEEEKSVDGDRDRKNPQFIPRNGAYFLHDDRLQSEDEEEETEGPATEEVEGSSEKAAEGIEKADGLVPEEGAADAKPKPKPKKNLPAKKSSPRSEAKKPKKEREEVEDKTPVVERWGHDLYNENNQASKTQDEIKDRYGYNIRDDGQAPRGKRSRRYARPVEFRGGPAGPRARGYRGGITGRGGPRGAPRGSKSSGPPRTDETETEVIEKENFNVQPDREREKVERPAQKPAVGPPRGTRGAAPARSREAPPRRPLQGAGDAGYEEENWQPRAGRYEELPPAPRTRGAARPSERPYAPQRDYEAPQRSYPARRYQPQQDDSYDDYEAGHAEFQSRVFFSRGRGPRRAGPGPNAAHIPSPRGTVRGTTFQTRPPAQDTRSYETPRPQPKQPLVGSTKPLVPPTSQSAPQSKRYSSRRGQNVQTDVGHAPQSDDVRTSGYSQVDYRGQNYRGAYPGRGGGGYPVAGGAASYSSSHLPAAPIPHQQEQYGGQYYGPSSNYYPVTSPQAPYYQGAQGAYSGNGYYQ